VKTKMMHGEMNRHKEGRLEGRRRVRRAGRRTRVISVSVRLQSQRADIWGRRKKERERDRQMKAGQTRRDRWSNEELVREARKRGGRKTDRD